MQDDDDAHLVRVGSSSCMGDRACADCSGSIDSSACLGKILMAFLLTYGLDNLTIPQAMRPAPVTGPTSALEHGEKQRKVS